MRGRTTAVISSKSPSPDKRYIRQIVFISLGVILTMIIAAIIAFILTIEGEEQTLVPDVRQMDLANAMIELQQKGLVGEVQLRVSANPADKGTVLNQAPTPGSLVKVGRSVELRVSKGPIIDEVEFYVGMRVSELRLQLESMSTIYGALITIREPVLEVYDDSPAGTILEQKPVAGTRISDQTDLELVVSRGPQGALITIPDYIGLGFYEALAAYSELNAPFVFYSRPRAGDEEEPGVVVAQSPAALSDVEEGTLTTFEITEPEAPEDTEEDLVFGILQQNLRDYPVPIDLIIEIEDALGETRELVSMKHPGGVISIPYLEPEGSEIVVSSSLRELLRYTVRKLAQ